MTVQLSGQPTLQEKFFRRTNQTWKGLKIGFKNGSLLKALEQIEMDLNHLDKLLDANEREAPVRLERKRRGNVKIWQAVREAAKSIYGTLAAHWQCPPGHGHAASLRLETRKATDLCEDFRFGLIISLDHHGPQPQKLLWDELKIEPRQSTPKPQADPIPKPPPSLPAAQFDPTLVPTSTGAAFKVTFMTTAPAITMAQAQVQPFVHTSASRNQIMGAKIKDLCVWQQTHLLTKDECIGFLEHQVWHHRLFRAKVGHTQSRDLRLLSLRQCVTGIGVSNVTNPTPSAFARGLSTIEKYEVLSNSKPMLIEIRYHIATVLASSVLQLANTPWLPGSALDLEEVFLLDLKQRALTTANPYIRRNFPSATILRRKPSTPLIENELVFALGVILIELAYQQPLANFKQPEDVDDQGKRLSSHGTPNRNATSERSKVDGR